MKFQNRPCDNQLVQKLEKVMDSNNGLVIDKFKVDLNLLRRNGPHDH